MDYTGGSGVALVVGEEFTAGSGNSIKVGQVVSDTGGVAATGTLEYVLKSGTQFVNTDSCTAVVSGKTFTAPTPTSVVAGFSADIAFPVIDITATPSGGTGISGTFRTGEALSQAVTGATGRTSRLMSDLPRSLVTMTSLAALLARPGMRVRVPLTHQPHHSSRIWAMAPVLRPSLAMSVRTSRALVPRRSTTSTSTPSIWRGRKKKPISSMGQEPPMRARWAICTGD
jgi:hypothetical protein